MIDKVAIRLAEANVLRAEAALEKHFAASLRAGHDPFENDGARDELTAVLHEAKAELQLATADYIMHGVTPDRWMRLREWLEEQDALTQSDDNEVYIRDVLAIMDGKEPS